MNETEIQCCDKPQTSNQKDEIVKPLLFSRHQIGKNCWFWVVGQFMEDPLGSGISSSPEEAFAEAQKIFGNLLMNRNWQARGEWIKRRAIERSKTEASATNAAAMEFAYECHDYVSDYPGDDGHCVTPHRIVKRTKARIYVEREPFRENSKPTNEWWQWHQPTFVLDRAEFERTGKSRGNRSRYYDTYYVSPDLYFAEVRSNARPKCFEILGVDLDAGEKAIKSAYFRLAKLAHPDAGGDIAKFKDLQMSFEHALAFAKRNDGKRELEASR